MKYFVVYADWTGQFTRPYSAVVERDTPVTDEKGVAELAKAVAKIHHTERGFNPVITGFQRLEEAEKGEPCPD